MIGSHILQLFTPFGEPVRTLDAWRSIDCTLVENDIGTLTVSLSPEYTDEIFVRDSRIAYTRSPQQGGYFFPPKLVGDTMWQLTDREHEVDDDGNSRILLICEHPNRIMKSRVVAYNEGTTQADKSDSGSDVMYDYCNENFVAATDTTRNLSSSHFVLDARPNPPFGATIDKAASYQTILPILQDIVQASSQQSAYIGFEVYVPVVPGPYHLRFYNHQRGTDRSIASGQPFILYSSYVQGGGLGAASVREDWTDVVSFVYAGGTGKDNERHVQVGSDASLINQSPFGRVEYFKNSSTDDDAVLLSEAQQALRQFRPQRNFSTDYSNQNEYVYDLHYSWGDVIGAQFLAPIISFGQITGWVGYLFDVRVNPVHITVQRFFDENGYILDEQETVSIHLQNITST